MCPRLALFVLLFALGSSLSIVADDHGIAPVYDRDEIYVVALSGDGEPPAASIREHAIAWHPVRECYYLAADVVPLDSPHHPNTYETAIHLWRSPDLKAWTYLGVAVPRGGEGRFDAHGASSPAAMTYRDGRLYVAYSARKTARFTERGIGLAWSAENPEELPWATKASAISDLPGEDDDPGVLTIPGDDRMHCYHRTTGGDAGYRIVHTYSTTPQDPASWSAATDVTQRPDGIRAQELTGVAWIEDQVHLFIIEHGDVVAGAQIAHLVSDSPSGPFRPADPEHRRQRAVPPRLAYGGHFTPVVHEGHHIASFWTVFQAGPRYGLQGHPVQPQP